MRLRFGRARKRTSMTPAEKRDLAQQRMAYAERLLELASARPELLRLEAGGSKPVEPVLSEGTPRALKRTTSVVLRALDVSAAPEQPSEEESTHFLLALRQALESMPPGVEKIRIMGYKAGRMVDHFEVHPGVETMSIFGYKADEIRAHFEVSREGLLLARWTSTSGGPMGKPEEDYRRAHQQEPSEQMAEQSEGP